LSRSSFETGALEPDTMTEAKHRLSSSGTVGRTSSPRRAPLEIDDEMYKWRHLIENYVQKFKEFKGIAMRSDKTDTSYSAMINLCAGIVNSR
jgi:hypothetical protein